MSTEIKQILAAFEKFETIIIHRHINPDPDAIGSQTGLTLLLRAAYPQKTIYTVDRSAARRPRRCVSTCASRRD